MSRRQAVREVLMQKGQETLDGLAEYFGVSSYTAKAKLKNTLQDLIRRGEVGKSLRPDGGCLYLWIKERGRGGKQRALWRGALINKTGFKVKDLALLAECGVDYARRVIDWWRKEGWVERIGQGVYRVTPGKEKGMPRHWNRREERRGRSQVQLGNETIKAVDILHRRYMRKGRSQVQLGNEGVELGNEEMELENEPMSGEQFIKAMRKAAGWTEKELGKEGEIKEAPVAAEEIISRLLETSVRIQNIVLALSLSPQTSQVWDLYKGLMVIASEIKEIVRVLGNEL